MQGVVSPWMFFVSCGTLSRIVSDNMEAFREDVIRCRVRRLCIRTKELQSMPSSWLGGSWMPQVAGSWLQPPTPDGVRTLSLLLAASLSARPHAG